MRKCNVFLLIYCPVIFFLLLTSAHGLSAQTGTVHSDKLSGNQNQFFNAVSEELICQCGCNLVLSQCGHINCPSAVPMRNKIEEMILAQKSKEDILKFFITEYRFNGRAPAGRAILSQPGTEGFDLVAWIMPFVLLSVFSVVVVFIIRKTSKTNVLTNTNASAAPDDLDKRVEEELKKWDSE